MKTVLDRPRRGTPTPSATRASLVLAAAPNAGEPEGLVLPLWLAATLALARSSSVINDTRSQDRVVR